MIIDIPKKNKLVQGNDGELQGSLSRTFNVDLEQDKGKITLSRRLNRNTTLDSLDLANAATSFFADRYFSIVDGTIYKSSADTEGDPNVGMIADTSTGTPTDLLDLSDLKLFNGRLYALGEDFYKKDGSVHTSTWVDLSYTGTSRYFRTSDVYANRLYFSEFTNGKGSVYSITTADIITTSGANTLDLPDYNYIASSIRAASDGLWIAASNRTTGRAKVYKWDGVTENTIDASYNIPDVSIKSLIIHNDRPYIVTGCGIIMTFNGSFFEEIARFPFDNKKPYNFASVDRDGWTHDNAIAVIDGQIHILISNKPLDSNVDLNKNNRLYGGIWVLNEQNWLYHKYAFSAGGWNSSANYAANPVNINKVGALFQAATYYKIDDFEKVGKFMCTADYYDSGTLYGGIFAISDSYEDGNDTSYELLANLGWYVTSQIQAEQVTESWQDIIIAFKKLANSTDHIVIKARSNDDDGYYANATFTSTTTFTSTDTTMANIKTDFDNNEDQEITFLDTKNGGWCSHIENIAESGGTYTVTVDETLPSTSVSSDFYVEKWNKLGTITDSNNELTWDRFAVGLDGKTWVQFKVFMIGKGTSPTIERLISVSEPKNTYK